MHWKVYIIFMIIILGVIHLYRELYTAKKWLTPRPYKRNTLTFDITETETEKRIPDLDWPVSVDH